ncbi:MAG: hypothetical protein A2140_06850 [Candidatus Muproteobacteria bacterium RBG_16_62_13]|uniref:Uncharacterized protein n=1 Tax=Candidatus Muproteobacteria bacterium RBG_16_62_13 TaxID=1817756 RepID=A0A1F6T3N0_9PROT|nr:MAG: hypothetical protein A2140_06850 [Candidatus Muproteobacteria bacterium RBG_16_62_13]
MAYTYPQPQDIGIAIPATLRPERFRAGFSHGLRGGQLDHVEYFRLSFRMGFRTAKLYLREVRRRRGLIEFPMRARFRQRATGLEHC